MPKFVIFGSLRGGFLPSAEAAGALVVSGNVANPVMKQIMRFHLSHNINVVFPLPFKSIWSRYFMKGIHVPEDDDVYFIFCEGMRLAYHEDCLRYFRNKYRHSRLIHYFRNPIAGPHSNMSETWRRVSSLYDAGITFSRYDADRFGLLYNDYWPCLLPEKEYQPENASDVFFIGIAKDRLPQILRVYERLAGAGLKCEFYVVGVPESEQKYSDVIHYNQGMPYDGVLQAVKNTKCVLEILPYGENYSSLRPLEALCYRKKLLTTNLNAPSEWFYHPEIVSVFNDASDIDPEFIAKPLTPEDEHRIFDGMNIGDFNIFADFLIKNVHRKES